MGFVPKSDEEQLLELEAALAHMVALAKHFHETNQGHYLLGIITQLRALVAFDPTGKSKALRPLLLDQADKYDVELRLFSRPPKPRKGAPGLAGSILAYKTWSVFPKGDFLQYTLRDWLLVRAFYNDRRNEYENRNRLIRDLANKSAAHYDDHVTEFADSIRRGFGSRYKGDQFFIVDTSAAICYLGIRFIRIMKARIEGRDPSVDSSISSLDAEFEALRISMT
jgi:hypothetical protein